MPEAGKYGIVYADPPWRYDMKRGNGVAENHYPTMSIEEICALPVADIAAKDSALFLWATFPQLNEAFRVIEAWEQRRGMPSVDTRTPETPVRGNPPVCDLPYRAAQQETGRGTG